MSTKMRGTPLLLTFSNIFFKYIDFVRFYPSKAYKIYKYKDNSFVCQRVAGFRVGAKNALEIIEGFDELEKKRFACAHCGNTWIELVGLVAGLKDGNDDVYFQFGHESDVCQTCRFRPRVCPKCGSHDAYEIKFSAGVSTEIPLSFEGIRKVTRG